VDEAAESRLESKWEAVLEMLIRER